jgi:homoserine kinase
VAATRVHVDVPGSSANLGPGYDCLAIALPLRLRVAVERRPGPLAVDVVGEGADALPRDASNLIAATLLAELDEQGDDLAIAIDNAIPLGAGCGSSAAAIVAALAAADALRGREVAPASLILRASAIEGHPDNVAASVLGGSRRAPSAWSWWCRTSAWRRARRAPPCPTRCVAPTRSGTCSTRRCSCTRCTRATWTTSPSPCRTACIRMRARS